MKETNRYDTLEASKIPWKLWNAMMEEDGDDYLAPSCEIWRSITNNQGGKEHHTIKWWKANWTGHTLRMNCFLKHVAEVKKEQKTEENGRQGRRRKQLLDEGNKQILEIERRSTRSLFLENSHWQRLRTCRKTDYVTIISHCTRPTHCSIFI